MGAKRRLSGTSKMNRHTHRQTNRQTYGQIDLQKASTQRADALQIDGYSRNSWTPRVKGSGGQDCRGKVKGRGLVKPWLGISKLSEILSMKI